MVGDRNILKLQINKPEKKIIDMLTQQYYNYISLLKVTKNLLKKQEIYQTVDLDSFNGCMTFIGNITQIQKDQKYNGYVFPIVNTPINLYFFSKPQSPYARLPYSPIIRKFAIKQEDYIKYLLLPFNKVVSLSKKDKWQYFAFTHLEMFLNENKQLYFSFTSESHIIQLEPQFFKTVLQPLENSLQYNFGEINLNLLYPNLSQQGQTFPVSEVKSKINSLASNISLMGRIRKIHRDSLEKAVNAKEKEVVIDIVQEIYSYNYNSLGLCRIYIRFDILDEAQMMKYLQQDFVYVFIVSETDINKNLQLTYKLNHWKINIIKVTQDPLPPLNIQDKYQNMKVGKLSNLYYPVIFRNHYKFRLVKIDIKFMNLKVICQKCEGSVLKIGEEEYRCRNDCGVIQGKLHIWIIIGCMDCSGYAEMTLQDQTALDFFDLESEVPKIKSQILKEGIEPGKSLTLYFKKQKQKQEQEQFEDGIIYDKNGYLLKILNICQIAVIEKEVVVQIKPATSDILNSSEQSEQIIKQQSQNTFAQVKELVKKRNVFLNGRFKSQSDRIRLVPLLKAERIFPVSTII